MMSKRNFVRAESRTVLYFAQQFSDVADIAV